MAASYSDDNYCRINATYCKRKPTTFNKPKLGSPDFIPLETYVSDYDDIIPRIVTGDKRGESDAPDIIPRIVTGDKRPESDAPGIIPRALDNVVDGDEIGIIPCIVGTKTRVLDTEFILRGVSLKAIKWYQTQDGLKIDLSLHKLPKTAYSSRKRRRVSDAASVSNSSHMIMS